MPKNLWDKEYEQSVLKKSIRAYLDEGYDKVEARTIMLRTEAKESYER